MATKLKKMRLTSVDLVRAGANQKADICLYKSADAQQTQDDNDEIRKDGYNMIKIDKSRFTADELEQYEELIRKAAVDPEIGEEEMEDEKPPVPQRKKRPVFFEDMDKADDDFEDMDKGCKTRKSAEESEDIPDVYKSALAHQEERLAELEKSIAMKEYTEIAKKYAPLGENEEELAKTLYEMAQSSPEAYDKYISILNKSLDLVEKSGIFHEIGKSGNVSGPATTVGKVESIAKGYMQNEPSMTYEEAMMKAWDDNPDLIKEYELEYRE